MFPRMRTLICTISFFFAYFRMCHCFCYAPHSSCCLSAQSLVSGAAPGAIPKKMAFIIGAQKSGDRTILRALLKEHLPHVLLVASYHYDFSGTSFLFDELIRRHPNIRPQLVEVDGKTRTIKEPQFFSFPARRQKQFDEYLQLFSRSG
jgi:hypothetical protein